MLRARFSRLCVVASDVDALVSDYWDGQDWRFQWVRNFDGGVLVDQALQLRNLLQSVHLSARRDSWLWSFGYEDTFLVKETRLQLDRAILPSGGLATRWNRWLPIKFIIFI